MTNTISKPSKKHIRLMIVLCLAVLMAVFAALGVLAQEEAAKEKESAAAVIEQVLNEKGIDAAKAKFFLLKTKKEDYSFIEAEFTALGNKLLQAGRPQDTVAVLEMEVKLYPDSINVYWLLANAHYVAGNSEQSIKVISKMKSIREEATLAEFVKENEGKLATTAEEVIERHIEAIGGREAWKAVKTMLMVFSVQSTRGEQPRLVRMYKRPFFYRQGFEGSDQFTATDGESVWEVSDKGWRKMEGDSNPYAWMASIDNWFIDYSKKGVSYMFIGLEYLEGSPVYHLRRTFWDGSQQDLFISALTNLLTEVKSDYVQMM
ncbi:MAG: tetratricopeptide repeat protein, partial [Candidatus Aminicenantes bacterium]|nr:tetratricopeptide repeat protein [Candidatus Aminicenantes bacterium]